MINTPRVKQFRDDLQILLKDCDEFLKTRTPEPLFKGSLDYENSLIAQKFTPDLYYKLIIFDKRIELRYHSSQKYYYLYTTNFVPKDNKDLIYIRYSGNQYRIDIESSEFADYVEVFKYYCIKMINECMREPTLDIF